MIFEEDAPSIGRYCFDQSNPTIYYYAEKTGFDDNGDGLADFDKALRAEIIGFSPKMGISVVQIGTELSWMIDDESGVKEYQVIDVKSGEVIAVVTTGDASYSLTLPEGVDVKVVVVADSGYQQSFFPDDSFDDINTTVYDLMEGWNLISITGSNPDLTGLKAEMDGVMWAWNGVEYEVISETYPTQGIWLYSKRDCQVTVTSERVDEQIALQQGWNMVGPVKNCEQLADSLITYKWEPVYERVPTPSILFEGVGYWMFSMEEE